MFAYEEIIDEYLQMAHKMMMLIIIIVIKIASGVSQMQIK